MKTLGIIAEYNPFHNGHKYQLDMARERLGAEGIVVVLGSDFTQRGLPALTDRHLRAEMALRCGADLVLGMPIHGGCDSAEGFARSGVAALTATGIVTDMLCGTEEASAEELSPIAGALSSPDIGAAVSALCREGLPYPAAVAEAVTKAYGESLSPASRDKISSLISTPNNILAIEYLRAIRYLKSNISLHTLPRVGAAHHASASAIREAILSGNDAEIRKALPEEAYSLLLPANEANELIAPVDTALLLSERLIAKESYEDIYGVSADLSNRIINMRDGYTEAGGFAELLKTKNLTRSHIDRALAHILLGLTDADEAAYRSEGYAPYLYVLGVRRGSGEALLGQLADNAAVPVLTTPKDVSALSATATSILRKDLYACDLYRILKTQKSGRTYPTEYTRRFMVMPVSEPKP